MHNKVVYHAMKAFSSFGLPVLRFNFRGVGLSEGTHDEGRGEEDDVRIRSQLDGTNLNLPNPLRRLLLRLVRRFTRLLRRSPCERPHRSGSSGQRRRRDYTYGFLPKCTQPKLFISGDHDQYGPRAIVEQCLRNRTRTEATRLDRRRRAFLPGNPSSPSPKLNLMQKRFVPVQPRSL